MIATSRRIFEGAALVGTAGFGLLLFIASLHLVREQYAIPGHFYAISLTLPWLIAGLVVPLYIFVAGLVPATGLVRRVGVPIVVLLAIAALGVVTMLVAEPARKFLLVIALAETGLLWALPSFRARGPIFFAVVFAAITGSWALSAGLPYTPLGDWLVNATPSSAFAVPAFVIALLCVVLVLAKNTPKAAFRLSPRVAWPIALAFFAVQGLRTDNEAALWIPYHQSYFSAPADLVRNHHWLLWDTPSQYGFFSVLALAATPGKTIIDALHNLTALVLLIQAAMLFAMFRFRRSGVLSTITFAALIGAVFYSSQASYYPFGARLYPQEGLRFLWPVAIVFVAFLRYRYPSVRSRRAFLALGFLVWACGILWSFETGVWTTVTWIGYLIADVLAVGLRERRAGPILRTLAADLALLVGTPLLAFAAVQGVYLMHFHHGADWLGFTEFTSIYTSSASFALPVYVFGAGWIIIATLIALTAAAVFLLARRKYESIPLLAAAWAAMWATSTYYVGEPFESHASSLAGVVAFALAAVLVVTERYRERLTPLLARLAFAPFCILMIAYAGGGVSHMHDMIVSFQRTNMFDMADSMPTISGELLALENKAGIGRDDAVLYPNSIPWNKISGGLILPLEKAADGTTYERHAWLPLSPVGESNAMLTLSWPRRNLYIERFLDDARDPQGWYITYRVPADCTQLSPRLASSRQASTANYHAVYCRLSDADHRAELQAIGAIAPPPASATPPTAPVVVP